MSHWANSQRRNQLPANWHKIRNQIRNRANNQCETTMADGTRCPNQGTDCHHTGHPNNHNPDALQWVCRGHHNIATTQQATTAAKQKKQATTATRKAAHPGRITHKGKP